MIFSNMGIEYNSRFIRLLPKEAGGSATSAHLLGTFHFVNIFGSEDPYLGQVTVRHLHFAPRFRRTFTRRQMFRTINTMGVPKMTNATQTTTEFVI